MEHGDVLEPELRAPGHGARVDLEAVAEERELDVDVLLGGDRAR